MLYIYSPQFLFVHSFISLFFVTITENNPLIKEPYTDDLLACSLTWTMVNYEVNQVIVKFLCVISRTPTQGQLAEYLYRDVVFSMKDDKLLLIERHSVFGNPDPATHHFSNHLPPPAISHTS